MKGKYLGQIFGSKYLEGRLYSFRKNLVFVVDATEGIAKYVGDMIAGEGTVYAVVGLLRHP